MTRMLRVTTCLALALAAVGLTGATNTGAASESPDEHEEGKHSDEHEEGEEAAHGAPDAVSLSPQRREALGIEVKEVGPGRIDSGIELLGEVHPNGDRLAHIVPRFPGIVREVRRSVGEQVRSGDVLAIIESSDSLAPYELKTLLDGVVLTKHLTRGEAVDREKEAFVIADLSSVWVDLSVYQKDLARVKVGQEVRIHTADQGPDTEGTISYLAPAVDQVTRTALARVVVSNPDRTWLPGMFVTAHTLDAREASVVASRSAIQTVEDRLSVFVETGDGFAARPITLGEEGETLVEVVDGLASGERIAVSNTFLLKAELAKGEAEHEH